MSFFEAYLSKSINFSEEIMNIEGLIHESSRTYESIYDFVEQNILMWRLRGTANTLKRFYQQSGLDCILESIKNGYSISLDDFLKYIEFIFTMTRFYVSQKFYQAKNDVELTAIYENLEIVLEKINHQVIWVEVDDNFVYAKCIIKDLKVNEAAEIVKENRLAEKIYMYNHRELKGDIYEKAIILSRLYMFYEGVEKDLKANNFGTLCKILGELSDKMNIRHKPTRKEELIIKGMTEKEIEKIYDKLFGQYLSAIIISEYLKDKDFLEQVRIGFNKNNDDSKDVKPN